MTGGTWCLQVLHLDRNSYYGGASASLTLDQLYKRYKGPEASPPPHLGSSKEYNIDLAPKFIMAHGKLVKVLVHTGDVGAAMREPVLWHSWRGVGVGP